MKSGKLEAELQKIPESVRRVFLLGHPGKLHLAEIQRFNRDARWATGGTAADIPKRWRNKVSMPQEKFLEHLRSWGIPIPDNARQWDIFFTSVGKRYPDPLPKPYAAADVDLFSEGFMTTTQAAKHLGVSADTLYRAMKRGQLPFYKMGKGRRIPIRALRIWSEHY